MSHGPFGIKDFGPQSGTMASMATHAPGKHGIAATARNLATSTKPLSLCEEK